MNKEETEILNNLDTKLELEKEGHILTYEETYAIARLISEYEDLQQENEELKSENKNILKYAERDYKINLKIEQKENQQLKDRNDKAIKYIEHYTEYYKVDGKDYLKAMRNYGLEEYQITELLEILKGENND